MKCKNFKYTSYLLAAIVAPACGEAVIGAANDAPDVTSVDVHQAQTLEQFTTAYAQTFELGTELALELDDSVVYYVQRVNETPGSVVAVPEEISELTTPYVATHQQLGELRVEMSALCVDEDLASACADLEAAGMFSGADEDAVLATLHATTRAVIANARGGVVFSASNSQAAACDGPTAAASDSSSGKDFGSSGGSCSGSDFSDSDTQSKPYCDRLFLNYLATLDSDLELAGMGKSDDDIQAEIDRCVELYHYQVPAKNGGVGGLGG